MNKTFLIVIAVLCFIGAITMYVIGANSSHLTELQDFWYVPISLGIIAVFGLFRKSLPVS